MRLNYCGFRMYGHYSDVMGYCQAHRFGNALGYTPGMLTEKLQDRWQSVAVAALFVVATVWMTWPLTPKAGSTIQDPGDPLFEIWVMRAVQHRLVNHPLNLYDGNAFYPFENSLAYSEEAISTALLTWPAYLATGNDVLAYNLIFLFSFWLVGFAVYLLARELGASPGAAVVAGVVAAFAPARYAHLSHLHLLVIGWLPLAMWALTAFVRGGRRRYLAIAGVALAVQLLASLHIAVFGTLALGLYLLFLLGFGRQKRPWLRGDVALLGVALVVPYVLFAFTLLPHLAVGDEYGFVRTREEIQRFSATPRSYLSVFPTNHFWQGRLETIPSPFFPGAVAILGAGLSLLAWRRWPVWFAGVLALVAMLISFGFSLNWAGYSIPMPYTLLYELFPPIRNIRGVGRFGLLTAIGIPLLAAFGYTALWRQLRGRLGQYGMAVGVALTALLVVAACVELRSGVGTWEMPEEPPVYEWLAAQPPGPLIEFPADGLITPHTDLNTGVFEPIRYMYYSTRHWNPIIAGYSGFAPEGHFGLIRYFAAADGRPSMVTAENVGVLQDLDVRWVIIHERPGYDWQTAVSTADTLPQLRRVAQIGGSVVYEVNGTSP